MAGVGGSGGGEEWRQLYLNNNLKKLKKQHKVAGKNFKVGYRARSYPKQDLGMTLLRTRSNLFYACSTHKMKNGIKWQQSGMDLTMSKISTC